MRICSIDIGKVNFAYCIEEVDMTKYDFSGKILHYENLNLTEDVPTGPLKSFLHPQIFLNLNDKLDQHKEILSTCDYIVIEQQMSFGKKVNPMALKIGQHCFSYFLINYKDIGIIEFPAYNKTQILNAPTKMNYTQRKKWAISKASEILVEREDYDNLTLLTCSSKMDDLADVLIQSQAFKICLQNNNKIVDRIFFNL